MYWHMFRDPTFWLLFIGFLVIEVPQGVRAWQELRAGGLEMPLELPTLIDYGSRFGAFLLFAIGFWRLFRMSHPTRPLAKAAVEQDALDHLIVNQPYSRRLRDLEVDRQHNSWPILHPISLQNTRSLPIELMSCVVSFEYNDPLHGWVIATSTKWNTGDKTADNDCPMRDLDTHNSFHLQRDQLAFLRIPINVARIQPKPPNSPHWRLNGTLKVRCGSAVKDIEFGGSPFMYQLQQPEWESVVSHVEGPRIARLG